MTAYHIYPQSNHDIWWMEGQYHNRNKLSDSPDVMKLITEGMKVAVLNEKIHGSYVRVITNILIFYIVKLYISYFFNIALVRIYY